eukprot:CAMPEP_0173436724 /NCGR_PEP_ID=MMETSP1357-20121228/17019_1 /TAXON_ID=77926 /ORGANISM="Hemiselmis rufescens, Strain PCC563" /LENGTH=128 /DNA_ID=CAMNT_0014401845 /DNA_START=29 /DNA_END=416 /DNA_ORIENTATION=+
MFDTIQHFVALRSSMLTKIPGKVYENDRMSRDIHCENNTFRPSDDWWGNNDPNNRLEQAGVFLNSATPLLDGEIGQANSMFSMADGAPTQCQTSLASTSGNSWIDLAGCLSDDLRLSRIEALDSVALV